MRSASFAASIAICARAASSSAAIGDRETGLDEAAGARQAAWLPASPARDRGQHDIATPHLWNGLKPASDTAGQGVGSPKDAALDAAPIRRCVFQSEKMRR